jgi:hypothetical protein
LIQEESVKPDPEKIGPAVAQLDQQFPSEDVRVYLTTLLSQDPETWGALDEVIKGRAASGQAE